MRIRINFAKRYAVLAAAFLFTVQAAFAQNDNTPSAQKIADKVDEYMNAAVKNDQFSGSVLVAKDGSPFVSKGYGMANYELNVPNTPKTVFRIASLTKQFTAMAIVQLQERGKLNVGDSICRYLEDCPSAWQPVTIRHLLTHTSGIKNYSSLPDWDDRISRLPYTRTEFVKVFRDIPLQFSPGEKFAYSNSGYYLLGLIIERVSGKRYQEFLRENIFGPLAMKNSGYADPPTLIPNRATGYYWASNSFVNAPLLNLKLSFAGGGIYSTTEDMLLWDKALYTEKLVSRKSLEEIFTPFLGGYAYGWRIVKMHGRTMAGHSGSFDGFSTFIARFPSERTTIIVLSNSDRTSAAKVSKDIAAIVFGDSYELPKPQISDVLSLALAQRGIDAAEREFREILRERAADYNLGNQEKAINELGYALLEEQRVKEAIRIFTLNVELAPRSANAHDSLAEAYMLNGDKPMAIAHYARSLELDPANQNAIKMLEKLRKMN